jgi:insulysin
MRPAMFSAAAVDVGVPEDVQNWHRSISPKVPSYWVYTKPIQKSQQDDREYRLIRLDNGLQAMLVHDAKADKAAASLDVAVGHLHDPVSTHWYSLPLLFLGCRSHVVFL